MLNEQAGELIAGCPPGVRESDLRAVGERAAQEAARLGSVRYLGSVLMCEEEVVPCLFRGGRDEVRRVAGAVELPLERDCGRPPALGVATGHDEVVEGGF